MENRKLWYLTFALCVFCANSTSASELPYSTVINNGFLKSTSGTSERYWANPAKNAILKSDLQGNTVSVVIGDLQRPYGLVNDAENNLLLWTSSSDEVVRGLSADGKQYDLNTSFDFPYTVVANTKDTNIAYTIKKNQLLKISQNKFSEQEDEEVLALLPDSVRGLSHDINQGQLYIGDKYGRMIMRFDLGSKKISKLSFQEINIPVKPSKEILVESSIPEGDSK